MYLFFCLNCLTEGWRDGPVSGMCTVLVETTFGFQQSSQVVQLLSTPAPETSNPTGIFGHLDTYGRTQAHTETYNKDTSGPSGTCSSPNTWGHLFEFEHKLGNTYYKTMYPKRKQTSVKDSQQYYRCEELRKSFSYCYQFSVIPSINLKEGYSRQ